MTTDKQNKRNMAGKKVGGVGLLRASDERWHRGQNFN